MKVRDRILVLTDLFLGAETHRHAVRTMLADLLLVAPQELPPEVEARIGSFEPARFDLRDAARSFLRDPPMQRRRLLELVAHLVEADGVVDLAQDEYLRRLGSHLGMAPEDYEDLVLEYEIEELRQSFIELTVPEA